MTAGVPPQTIALRKPYKAREPLATIALVRRILRSCDLFTIEAHRVHTGPGVYCCRVYLGDEDVAPLDLGTNGKALSRRYSLASAYGELMERLQNGALVALRHVGLATRACLDTTAALAPYARRLDEEGITLDFRHAPDEVHVAQDDLLRDCPDLLAHLLEVADGDGQRERLRAALDDRPAVCVPYYSVRDDRVVQAPVDLIWAVCGTNGMCAGNTPAEALVEGLSELCERFAHRALFLDGVTPPEVPLELFAGTEVYDHLRWLRESTGLVASMRDCSLGLGLPVVGLLLATEDSRRYSFHLGADPCPSTALMRCLSETYQGEPDMVQRRFHDVPAALDADWDRGLRQRRFTKAFLDASAEWPPTVHRPRPTYEFEGFAHPVSVSDEDDLAYMTRLILDAGHELLVRDVSYLGFPAYHIYIPGMSATDRLFDGPHISARSGLEKTAHVLFDIRRADREDLRAFALALERALAADLPGDPLDLRHWFINSRDGHRERPTAEELPVLVWARLGEYGRAAEAVARVLRNAGASTPLRFWGAVRDYCAARGRGDDAGAAAASLRAAYGETLAERVLAQFGEPEQVFAHGTWPNCFRCDECAASASCVVFGVVRRVRCLQDRYLESTPDQRSLAAVFDGRGSR